MGHLRSTDGSQHEPNKNPGPLHDRKSYAKGLHPRSKRNTKLPHRIRLSRANSQHLQRTFSRLQGILETPWTSRRKVGRARDWSFLFVGLLWEGGGATRDVVVFRDTLRRSPSFWRAIEIYLGGWVYSKGEANVTTSYQEI